MAPQGDKQLEPANKHFLNWLLPYPKDLQYKHFLFQLFVKIQTDICTKTDINHICYWHFNLRIYRIWGSVK